MSSDRTPLRDRLRKKYDYLIVNLTVSSYVDALFAKGVISVLENEHLRHESNRHTQARYLLDSLMCKSESTIGDFVEIVRRKAEQPQIYETLCSPEEIDTEWENVVTPCFTAVAESLRPSLLLNGLRQVRLITATECEQLEHENFTEAQRSRKLLNSFLPQKGKGSFQKFCEVLLAVEGQRYIVRDILKVGSVGATPTTNCVPDLSHALIKMTDVKQEEETRPEGTAGTTDHPVGGIRNITASDHPLESSHMSLDGISNLENSVEMTSMLTSFQKSSEDETNTGVTFYFRKEDKRAVKPMEDGIRSICEQWFGISNKAVLFVYGFVPVPVDRGTPVYLDARCKLAAIQMYGVEQKRVRSNNKRLVVCIADILQVPISYVRFSDVAKSSCLVVLVIQLAAYLNLLCALGDEVICTKLYQALQQIFPELREAVFRLGGLPPIPIHSIGSSQDEDDTVFETKCTAESPQDCLELFKVNKGISSSLSHLVQRAADIERTIQSCFALVDPVSDSSEQCRKKVSHFKSRFQSWQNFNCKRRFALNRAISHQMAFDYDVACFTRIRLRQLNLTGLILELVDVWQLNVDKGVRTKQELKKLMCRTSDTHCLVEKIKSSLDQLQVSCEPLGDSTKRKVADAGGGGVSEISSIDSSNQRVFKIEREELASNHAPVWDIPTEDVTEERAAETVNDPNVRNPTTGRPGRRLDLSRLPIREDLQATILSDKTTFTSVTVMNLNDCGLQSLLRAISNMANLVRLRLHSNDLKTLPETIGDLRFLERLSVYGSNLESLPRSCSRLDSLKILRLGGNKLEDGGLDVIQNMSGLEQLYLRQNYELKAIPREVCLLDKLTVLDAEYCEELEYPPLRVVARGIDRVRAYAERYDW